MGLGEGWWFFESTPLSSVKNALDLLDRRGLRYRHPVDGLIYAIDESGTRHEASDSFISAQLTARHALTMQLWLDGNADVVVTAEAGGGSAMFGLDGLTVLEAEIVVSALVFGACVIEGTRGLVVDRSLPDSGDTWRRTMAATPVAPAAHPDLLITVEPDRARVLRGGPLSWVRADYANEMTRSPTRLEAEYHGELVTIAFRPVDRERDALFIAKGSSTTSLDVANWGGVGTLLTNQWLGLWTVRDLVVMPLGNLNDLFSHAFSDDIVVALASPAGDPLVVTELAAWVATASEVTLLAEFSDVALEARVVDETLVVKLVDGTSAQVDVPDVR